MGPVMTTTTTTTWVEPIWFSPRERDLVPTTEIDRRLVEHAADSKGAFSQATHRAWASDSKLFVEWCRRRKQSSLPALPETVAQFVDSLAKERKVATLRRYLATIAHLHTAAGLADPTKTPKVKSALKRAARSNGSRQAQARGLTEEDVERILALLDDTLKDLRDRALLLVGRDLLARRSELVGLTVEDVEKSRGGSGTALIRRSKTDQQGEGVRVYLSPGAMSALQEWLDAAEIEGGAIFRKIDRWRKVWPRALGSNEVSNILKRLAERAGLEDAEKVSGHSLRVGMAQDLVEVGTGLPELMQAGRWKSPAMPARYAEKQLASRGAVAKYHQRKRRRA